MNDKWDRRFLRLAAHVAEWSKDPSTKVGCILVDDDRRVIATGYNGFPRGVTDTRERYMDREMKLQLVVHAEANALLSATVPTAEATAYLTHPPCSSCTKLLIQAGIARVVFPPPTEEMLARWGCDFQASGLMLHEANVYVDEVHP